MPKKKSAVDEKIEQLENLDFDSIELKTAEEKQVEQMPLEEEKKQSKKDKKNDKKDDGLTQEQKEIAKLKSQLMQEKIKNVGRKKSGNFITKKEKRTFRDTSNDSNATTKSILLGAGFMALVFGFLALLILIIKH